MIGTNKLVKGFVNFRKRIDFLLTEDSYFLELEQGGLIRIPSNIAGIGISGNNSTTIKGKNRL